jgi:hypothetical protein
MNTPKSKSALSAARRRLVELMQQVNFGHIENLVIRDGDPVFDPSLRVVHEIKFCAAENGPRAELASGDFRLKGQLVELFQRFDQLDNATIEKLEIKHGLPFRLFHAERLA